MAAEIIGNIEYMSNGFIELRTYLNSDSKRKLFLVLFFSTILGGLLFSLIELNNFGFDHYGGYVFLIHWSDLLLDICIIIAISYILTLESKKEIKNVVEIGNRDNMPQNVPTSVTVSDDSRGGINEWSRIKLSYVLLFSTVPATVFALESIILSATSVETCMLWMVTFVSIFSFFVVMRLNVMFDIVHRLLFIVAMSIAGSFLMLISSYIGNSISTRPKEHDFGTLFYLFPVSFIGVNIILDYLISKNIHLILKICIFLGISFVWIVLTFITGLNFGFMELSIPGLG